MKLSQIREVGALHFADGLTTREIEARTGISRSTAARIIALLEGAELPWEELAAADDSSLASALGLAPQAAGAAGDGYVQPDFEKVLRKQRQNRKLSVKACYEAFYANGNSGQAQGGLRLYSLSRFRELYREWLARRHGAASASAIPCGPGEIMEIDYSGDPLVWYSRGRKRHESQVFVAVMRYSGLLFAMATPDQTASSWLRGVAAALSSLGKAPASISCDNARPLVSKPDQYAGRLSPAMQEICDYYGVIGKTMRVKRPSDKSQAEAGVRWLQEQIQAPWRADGPILADDERELNRLLAARVEAFNRRPFSQKGPCSRRQVFEEEELPAMGPLPPAPYEPCEWRSLKADSRYLVKLGAHRYMVHHSLAGKQVWAKITAVRITFYDPATGKPVSSYERDYSLRGRTHTDKACMSHADLCFRSGPDGYLELLRGSCGGREPPALASFIRGMFDGGSPRMVAYRWTQGLLSMIGDYGPEKVEAACAATAGYSTGSKRYQELRRMVSSMTLEELLGMAGGGRGGEDADPAPEGPGEGDVYLRSLADKPFDTEQD